MDKTQALKELISLFLKINPTPSDQQFHALAAAIGVDHEFLESISYEMLAEDQTNEGQVEPEPEPDRAEVHAQEFGLSEAQEVLDGDYDPNTTTPQDLALNDGEPAGTGNTQGLQDAEYNDGIGPADTGIGIEGDKDAMISDGGPPVQLKAAHRLTAQSVSVRDFDRHLELAVKRYGRPTAEDGPDRNLVKQMDFKHNGHKVQFCLWANGYAEIKVDGRQVFDDTSTVRLNLFMKTQLPHLL